MVGADKARPSLFKSPTSLARTLTTQRCAAMMMLAKYKMKIEIKINIQIQIKTQIQTADFFCSCIYNTSPMMMTMSTSLFSILWGKRAHSEERKSPDSGVLGSRSPRANKPIFYDGDI